LKTAAETRALVTAEEHSIIGGLGSAVAEVISSNDPVPLERIGIQDVFARTGPDPDSLMDAYGLSVEDIIRACKTVMQTKQ
jgi:transketolase